MTIQKIMAKKSLGEKICMITCYDATFSRLVDQAGADIILVGDSLGTVIKGEAGTLNVSLEEIAYHTRAVVRGAVNAHIVADLPFMSYHSSDSQAIESAGFLIKSGANSVKLEGGAVLAPRVKKIVELGIPVMGHIGLMPQSVNAQGGYVVQGRTDVSKLQLIEDALALQSAGVYALVLECVQADVAAEITARLSIPTIGIGAGPSCDGQVLVLYDVLGLNRDFKPKFMKPFVDGATTVEQACHEYFQEVISGSFPSKENTFSPAPAKSLPN